MIPYIKRIAESLSISDKQVQAVVQLLADGATVPFISRYRKERTGNLDEVSIFEIELQNKKYEELQKRKASILETIAEQEKLTPALQKEIENTWSSSELEDLYLPYKPKKRTRATIAREKGLEPLADFIFKQFNEDLETTALKYLNDEVDSVEEALLGARDILAERVSEDSFARNKLRQLFKHEALITSKLVKKKEEEAQKYKDYFDFSEPVKKCPSHRMLAMRRGEAEGFLKITMAPDSDKAVAILEKQFVRGFSEATKQMRLVVSDSYKRLLYPSLETEFKKLSKEQADLEAIAVFARNAKQLLMAPPLGNQRTLAIDPGFRTGCKIVCLNESGDLVHNETIYPHPPQRQTKDAAKKIHSLIDAYKIQAIAIGNGTASRETENFIRSLRFREDVKVFMVNESGASIYSASSVAREEFPQYDVTVRGAVSIGRRLIDPLAELVKIDPKSIGVGQYQHDVDQSKLKENLDFVVESCVNTVGVDLNIAGKHLLSYVSGLGPKLAENIVAYRKENGAFPSRAALKKVPRMGAKAFEQCAGFLRIPGAKNPLDNSAVHPESYKVVEQMAKDQGCNVAELIQNDHKRKELHAQKYVSASTGLQTLQDILSELEKPGRDPRQQIKIFSFDPNVHEVSDLIPGMELPGIVTNITNFGAFVDVGVHQDGLVHVSQLADRFVSDPTEVVELNQQVRVKVVSVETDRKRISLTMKGLQ